MLEYSLDEAEGLLEKNLKQAQKALQTVGSVILLPLYGKKWVLGAFAGSGFLRLNPISVASSKAATEIMRTEFLRLKVGTSMGV